MRLDKRMSAHLNVKLSSKISSEKRLTPHGHSHISAAAVAVGLGRFHAQRSLVFRSLLVQPRRIVTRCLGLPCPVLTTRPRRKIECQTSTAKHPGPNRS